jgi:hypothetical protein
LDSPGWPFVSQPTGTRFVSGESVRFSEYDVRPFSAERKVFPTQANAKTYDRSVPLSFSSHQGRGVKSLSNPAAPSVNLLAGSENYAAT